MRQPSSHRSYIARFAFHAVPTNFAAPGVFLIADTTPPG